MVIRDSTSKETDAQRYEDLKRFSRDKFKRDAVNESAVKFVPSLSYYLIAENHPSVTRLGSTCSIMFEPRIQYRVWNEGLAASW